ncbi:MAG: RNA polymerase sigma factor [Patescibacteria group bacterium]|nr:RNA polymerase sigma factor [Patescibacteria group bacterium]
MPANPEAYENKSDEELVKLTLLNQDDFVLIVNRYKNKLYNYIRRITNIDAEEAEDILQEVFIKVYLNLNDFDMDFKFSSWIYRIAHNQVISHYRKTKARPQGYMIELEENAMNNMASDLDIVMETDKVILKTNIQKILNNIDKKYREVLILKFFEEKSYSEISDIIKRPMGTVASLINKAKQELKEELKLQEFKL